MKLSKKQFNELLTFFDNNDIVLKVKESCHKCQKSHEEDLDFDWLYDELVGKR